MMFGIVESLPSWECGLKSYNRLETVYSRHVTPFVGVWIEILVVYSLPDTQTSLPSWECGLKFII